MHKIPTIIEFVQSIFSQAWQISAIKEYDKEDSITFFSNMYNCYNIILIFTISSILIFLKIISKILFANSFYDAWKYVPFLLVAILFGALSGFLGSIYAANKDSKMYAKSTALGALLNILLNLLLIPKLGAHGAAIATCISYIFIWMLRLKFMKKYIVLNIHHKRNIISYIVLIMMGIATILFKNIYSQIINIILTIILVIIYKKDIQIMMNFVKRRIIK